MITDRTGLARSVQGPARRQLRWTVLGGRLQIDACGPGASQPPESSFRKAFSEQARIQMAGRGTPGRIACARTRRAISAHRPAGRPPRSGASVAMFSRSCSAVSRSDSMNVAALAPRDSASSPSAPLPANRSRQRLPSTTGASQLKRVSRTRSGVGRMPGCRGKRIRRPRHSPPIIRSSFGFLRCIARSPRYRNVRDRYAATIALSRTRSRLQ